MKKLFFIASVLFTSSSAFAQADNSVFTSAGSGIYTPFVRDYQSLGINPANLAIPSKYEEKKSVIGFFELGISSFSEAFNKPELRDNLFLKDFDKLTSEERKEAASEFVRARNVTEVNFLTFGLSVATNVGSFAFSSSENIYWNSRFGEQLADLVFYGFNSDYFDNLVLSGGAVIPNTGDYPEQNQVIKGTTNPQNAQKLSKILEDSDIETSWVREFRFGYGKQLYGSESLSLYGGIGLKYLLGMHIISMKSDGTNVSGYAATSPLYDLDLDPSGDNPSLDPINNGMLPEILPQPVGNGFGVDLGLSLVLDKRLTVAAALNNFGSMKWDGNVYTIQDTIVNEIGNPGVSSLSIIEQVETIVGNDGLLNWEGQKELKTKLPTNIRLGASYSFGTALELGVDVVAPFNEEVGSIEKPLIGLGGNVFPASWFRFSMGFLTGGNYDFKIPAGIGFITKNGSWEFGIASRDMITFFTEKDPTISLSTGFLRSRF
jgi:hypothetical protein